MNAVQLSNDKLGRLVEVAVGAISRKLSDLKPLVEELWRRFDQLEPGDTIRGCHTRKEFCEKCLGRTDRAVRYLLAGGNPDNHKRKLFPLPTPAEDFKVPSPDERPLYAAVSCLRLGTDHLTEYSPEELKALISDVEQLLSLLREHIHDAAA